MDNNRENSDKNTGRDRLWLKVEKLCSEQIAIFKEKMRQTLKKNGDETESKNKKIGNGRGLG